MMGSLYRWRLKPLTSSLATGLITPKLICSCCESLNMRYMYTPRFNGKPQNLKALQGHFSAYMPILYQLNIILLEILNRFIKRKYGKYSFEIAICTCIDSDMRPRN